LACGVDSVAVVGALTQATDPQAAARRFMQLMRPGGAAVDELVPDEHALGGAYV
jgi:hypothetical protein